MAQQHSRRSPNNPNPISIRLSSATAARVRTLAAADDERASVVLRRLIRLGLEQETRKRTSNEVA